MSMTDGLMLWTIDVFYEKKSDPKTRGRESTTGGGEKVKQFATKEELRQWCIDTGQNPDHYIPPEPKE